MTNITETEYDFVINWDGASNRDIDLIVNNVLISFNAKAVEYGLFYRAERHPILGEIGLLESAMFKSDEDDFLEILANAAMVENLAERVNIPSVMKVPAYSFQIGVLIDAMETMLPKHDLLIDNRDNELKVVEIVFKEDLAGVSSAGCMTGAGVSKQKALIVALMEAHMSISALGGM